MVSYVVLLVADLILSLELSMKLPPVALCASVNLAKFAELFLLFIEADIGCLTSTE